MMRSIRLQALSLLTLVYGNLAQQLQFLEPSIGVVNGIGLPHYTVGQHVKIRWTTDFDNTTLMVFQERLDGSYVSQILADRYSIRRTNTTWQVIALQGAQLGGAFHFMLENADNTTCSGCTLNSRVFNVTAASVLTSSTTSSVTSSATPSSTSTTQSSASAASSAGATAHTSTSSAKDRDIGLGVGLGVGLSVLLAILFILFCCFRRRKAKKSQFRSLPQTERIESGSSGTWLQQPMQERTHAEQFGPYRPSFAGMSDISGWSHTSWIEPFDFENAGSRDQDAMSQLRHSIYSARPSEWSSSNVDHTLDGIPETPWPVHARGPYS